MKFTIALADLEMLFNAADVKRPRKKETFLLSACAARVFVQTRGGVAGIETLVLSDGAVTLPFKKFREVLKTYKGTKFLTFEAGAGGLQIQNFHMPVLGFDPSPVPPADFQVFRASDPAALLGKPPSSEPPEDLRR
jgi:hypothetical protein